MSSIQGCIIGTCKNDGFGSQWKAGIDCLLGAGGVLPQKSQLAEVTEEFLAFLEALGCGVFFLTESLRISCLQSP